MSAKSAVLKFASDALDNSQLLLCAYLPVLALLLLYGGRGVILVTCFGGMMAYLLDLAQMKEGTITALILTGIGQWASILWVSSDLINYSSLYLLFMAVVGLFLMHVQYVCLAQFRSYWLQFAGPFAETVERMVFASAPIVVTPLLCWAIVVLVEGAHLPSVFALVYFCYLYVLYTPREVTTAVKKSTKPQQHTPQQQQQPNPIVTLPVLFYSYSILALVPFILHCSIYAGDMFNGWRPLFAALYSLTMPILLCTFLSEHHTSYFPQGDRSAMQHVTWVVRALAGLGTLMCCQSHPIFADLKRLSPLGEPISTIVIAVLFALVFISVMLLRGISDELLYSLGVPVRAATIVRSCVYTAAVVGAVLLRLPLLQACCAIAMAGTVAEYYLSRKLPYLGVAAVLAASIVFWYTHYKMWYLAHTFDWLTDVSMQTYCILLVTLMGMAIVLPGVARAHHRRAISAGTVVFSGLLAAAELIVREHSWEGSLSPQDVYPDTLLVASGALVGLAAIHLRRIKVMGDGPVSAVLAISAAKLLSVLGWDSRLIVGVAFTALVFTLPHFLLAKAEDEQLSASLSALGVAAASMAVAAFVAHTTFVPLLVSEYSARSSGSLQPVFLSVLLWCLGVLLLAARHYPTLYRLKRLLMATLLCSMFGAMSPHLPFQIDPSSSMWLVWADDTSDEQIFQLDVVFFCAALILLAIFKVIPLQSSMVARVIYSIVLGVVSGTYLAALLIGPSLLGFYYAVALASITALIGQQAFLGGWNAQNLTQMVLPVLCAAPILCTFGGLWLEPKAYHLAEDHWSNALVGIWWLFGICGCVLSTALWAGYQATTQPVAGTGIRRSGIGISVAAPDGSWMLRLSSFLAVVGYAALIFAGHRSPRPRWQVDLITLLLAFLSVLFSTPKSTGRLTMATTWLSKLSQFLAGYVLFAVSALAVSAADMLFVDGMLGYFSSPTETQTISEVYDSFGVRNEKEQDVGFWLAEGLFAPVTNSVWLITSLAPAVVFLYSHYHARPTESSAVLLLLPATALIFTQLSSIRLIAVLSALSWCWQAFLSYKQTVDTQRLI